MDPPGMKEWEEYQRKLFFEEQQKAGASEGGGGRKSMALTNISLRALQAEVQGASRPRYKVHPGSGELAPVPAAAND